MHLLDTQNDGAIRVRSADRPAVGFYPTNGLNPYTGYGRAELGLAKGLQRLGIDLKPWPDVDAPVLVVGGAHWLMAPHLEGTRIYLYTMSESDRMSEEWVALINARCEAVMVPCPPLVEIYRESGVRVAVIDVGMGVDLFEPPGCQTHQAGDQFTFLTYSLGDRRKGAHLAIMAFIREFEGDERYRLVVKARDGWANTWLAGFEHPQVEIVADIQSEAEWWALLGRADCFVFPSHGEGFGLPPREATLAGVPTIATEWLGLWDAAKWAIPLRIKEMGPCVFDRYEANAQGAKWAIPDDEELQAKMRWVAEHQESAALIAAQGRNYLLTRYSWSAVAVRVASYMVERAG